MSEWTGIRASAGIAIAGGALTLVFAAALGAFALLSDPGYIGPFSPALVKAGGLAFALLFSALSLWAALTGLAVLRAQKWGRFSMLALGCMLLFSGGIGVVAMLLTGTAPHSAVDPNLAEAVRKGILGTYLLSALLGAWWVLLFRSRKALAYFGHAHAPEHVRPFSITIIGYALLAQAAIAALSAVLNTPLYVPGGPFTGWLAPVTYSLHAGLLIYLGSGLLQLDNRARITGIAYLCVAGASSVAMFFLGDGSSGQVWLDDLERLLRLEPPPNPRAWIGVGCAMAGTLAPLYFLLLRRSAFAPCTGRANAANSD